MVGTTEHEPSTSADVTVVMPAMNRAHLIGRALDSIAAQTVRPSSVLVVDDASTDDTVRVAREHGASVLELAVNGGSGPARNRGIEAATTEWIAFLDSDDTWLPDHLETVLAEAGDRVLVGAPGRSSGGRIIGNAWGGDLTVSARSVLVPGDLICTSGVLVRRRTLLEAGLFRPLRRAQDLDMWIRVLELGDGVALGRPGFTYYLHEQQAIHDSDLMRDCYGQIVDYCLTRPWFGAKDADRAWARWHWDGLRAAAAAGDRTAAAADVRWLATRPHTWRTVVDKLRERRRSRAAES
ncbi:glycosyltransferase family 2 protein [Nocardioides sp. Leaf307]|uniref:glycosyltransferase family 2 protein n=1 Tax=Nocardioides sp. Leaf307 TaxID=1736331 RepID=UPI000702D7F2|nr:glycosyltransferase family A protein [Nocardioides sp. Leaf307]KQQ42954.1 hypothetical protein ASF50_02765 [Nocardioides sp. Leaf307]